MGPRKGLVITHSELSIINSCYNFNSLMAQLKKLPCCYSICSRIQISSVQELNVMFLKTELF